MRDERRLEMFQISLKAARVNAGLTVVEAAKALGICKERVMKYERTPGIVNPIYQKKISEVYKCPIDCIKFT